MFLYYHWSTSISFLLVFPSHTPQPQPRKTGRKTNTMQWNLFLSYFNQVSVFFFYLLILFVCLSEFSNISLYFKFPWWILIPTFYSFATNQGWHSPTFLPVHFQTVKWGFWDGLLQRPKAYLSKNTKECTKCEKNRVLTYIACISLPPMPYDLAVATLTRNFSFPNLHKYSGCIFYYCFALSEVTNACMHVYTSENTHVYTHTKEIWSYRVPWLEAFPFSKHVILYFIFY